jgi:hypothetical protein
MPTTSAYKIPDKYKFKMLIELGQLICSVGISDVYKKINQGKELQEWVNCNKSWVYFYFSYLFDWAKHKSGLKLKESTITKLNSIQEDFAIVTLFMPIVVPTDAYFRYHKDYKCEIASKTLLPLEECIKQYEDYLVNFKGVVYEQN